MSSNPFSSEDRNNFPEFDSVFEPEKVSPNNIEGKPGLFRWSIDQLAKLKPIDIGTSPASLAHTMNFCSPHDDPQSQAEVEKFFAQKCIHPSPWLPTKTQSKHVTFSPHPPSTTYFTRDDAIIKSDASTQTSLTIPIEFDLEKLLMGYSFYNGTVEENSFSLRRKLFGEPQRTLDDTDLSCDNNTKLSLDTQKSSTPVRSPFSPADLLYKDEYCVDQMTSSFVMGDNEAPPTLSPIISNDNRTPLNTTPTGTTSLCFSPIPEESLSTDKIIIKPILKRLYHGSPHPPEVKHYCPEVCSVRSEDSVPAPITIGDLQTDVTTPSTTCTPYFNNMEIIEECEKNVDSLVSSWQPPINSTMVAKPSVDSGYDTREQESNDIHILSCDNHMSNEFTSITQSDDYKNGLFFNPSPINLTPPSRYNNASDPVNRDLIRRKNYLKAKLNIANNY